MHIFHMGTHNLPVAEHKQMIHKEEIPLPEPSEWKLSVLVVYLFWRFERGSTCETRV